MRRETRLELVKKALTLMVPELDEGDTVGIVAFDKDARVVLEPVQGDQQERILDAIASLAARRNTNVNAGLKAWRFRARELDADRATASAAFFSGSVLVSRCTNQNHGETSF